MSVAIWPGSDAFERPKLVACGSALLISVAVGWRHFLEGIRTSPMRWPILAYFLSFLLPCVVYGFGQRSLFGSEAVADGLLAAGVGLIIMFAARSLADSTSGTATLLGWWMAGCTLAAAYSVMQRLGLDPIPWGIQPHHPLANLRFRTFGTLGNPSFLAMLLCMALPIGVWLSDQVHGWRAWLVLSGTGLCAVALGLSMCRTGIVAGALTLGFWGFVCWKLKQPLMASGIVALLLAFGIGFSGIGAPESSLDRFELLRSPMRGSSGVRMALAKSASKAIVERPLFGWGNGGVPEAFVRAGSSDLTFEERLNPSTHNLILDAGLERGIFGIFSLIWLGIVLIGEVRKPSQTGLNRVLGLSMGAYLLNAFIGFATVGPWFSLCLFIALLKSNQRFATPNHATSR